MFRSFKNLELFRHYVTSKVDDAINVVIEQAESETDRIIETVFSTITSAVVAYLSYLCLELNLNPLPIWKGILLLILYFAMYIVLYKFSSFVIKKIRIKKILNQLSEGELSQDEIKRVIDDFDHIVCDNMLIAYEFIPAYLKNKNQKIKYFYYYETLYYLRKAVDITDRIVAHKDQCINVGDIANGIDLFRLINVHEMMVEIFVFLEQNRMNINIDNRLKDAFNEQITSLDERIKNLDTICSNLL